MWGRAYRCRKCGARFRELATTAWAVIGAGALALLAIMTWGLWDPLAPADHADVEVQLERARERTGADDYAKAMRYLTGDGVPKDVNHAAALFERAAQDGSVQAQHRFGLLLRDGIGVVADEMRAVTWMRLAAEAGDASAQFELGRMYLEGQESLRDSTRAYAWLTLAAAQNVEGAAKARAAALAALPPAAVGAARAEARRLAEGRLPVGIPLDVDLP